MSCAQRFESGSPFGVKRPLRFLSETLSLSEGQHPRVAAILAELKTERAQAEVNERRSIAALSDAFAAATFDTAAVESALRHRAEGENALRAAVEHALTKLHETLDMTQRATFSHLLRTGQLLI